MTKHEDVCERHREGRITGEAHSFGYRLDPKKGVVICQVAESVTKEGW